MGILRSDRVSGLGGANAIVGSAFLVGGNDSAGRQTMNMKDSSLAIGTNEFCCDFWIYFVDIPTYNVRVVGNLNQGSFSNAQSWAYLRFSDGTSRLWDGSSYVSTGADNFAAGRWYHISIIRNSGNTQALYIDGSVQSTTVSNSNNLTNDEFDINGRTSDGAESFRAYFSNVRLTIGSGAGDLGGVVPNGAPPVLADTKILCCNDPGNILNESAQGISITTGRNTTSNASVGVASRFVPDVGEDYGTTFEDNTKFDTLSYMVPPGGTTAESNRGRAVIGWANNPVNTGMDYFSIQSMGNSISFGTLTSGNRWGSHALSSSTRGLFVGGYINTPAATFFNTIDYVTIATSSNPTDFGDVTTASYRSGCCSSSTRGIIALGFVTPAFGKVNTIDYVTIASTGNATNFGDLFQTRANMSSLSSPTRGVFAGGETPTYVNTIDYVTIATTGDASNFGDLNYTPISSMAMASTTRGIIGGGYPTPANTNIIDFITIASTGDATDFGDLTGLYSVGSATSNSIRGVFCGGYTTPSKHNLMEFVTIATTGNASDFGDMLYSRRDFGACSDSHGGIS